MIDLFGDDHIIGGRGNDVLIGDADLQQGETGGDDQIHGGTGDDRIYGDAGFSMGAGSVGGNDHLFGGAGRTQSRMGAARVRLTLRT